MRGIIDTGGGFRGIFGAGVFDYCLDKGISFDCCVGVSAGCSNIMAYLGKLEFQEYFFYTKWLMDPETLSLHNFFSKGSVIDMDRISRAIDSSGTAPFDYAKVEEDPAEFIMVTTRGDTGRPEYFTKDDMAKDDYAPIYASSSLPVVNRPYLIDGTEYFDGGISDPIPYRKALEAGCDRIAVILTRPVGMPADRRRDRAVARAMESRWPVIAKAVRKRASVYDRELAELRKLEKEGVARIIAPADIGHMKTLTKDTSEMKSLYRKGLVAAQELKDW
jgi:predicted patatin/cPLA2 family phospholipase